MTNTSATGGYLSPFATPAPLEGQSFEDFLQEVFAGISGLDPTLVRPRFQTEDVPNLPDAGVTWMALGITEWPSDTFAVEQHDGTGEGYDDLQRHEEVTILTSFYGPQASQIMAQLRDGFQIAQNREILMLNKMAFIETGTPQRLPSLVKEKWQERIDMPVRIRRLVLRSYPVLNLLSGHATVDTEVVKVSVNVNQ